MPCFGSILFLKTVKLLKHTLSLIRNYLAGNNLIKALLILAENSTFTGILQE